MDSARAVWKRSWLQPLVDFSEFFDGCCCRFLLFLLSKHLCLWNRRTWSLIIEWILKRLILVIFQSSRYLKKRLKITFKFHGVSNVEKLWSKSAIFWLKNWRKKLGLFFVSTTSALTTVIRFRFIPQKKNSTQ